MRPPALAVQVGLALALAAALSGGLVWVWAGAARSWSDHLDRAERAGVALYASLALPGLPPPQGVSVSRLGANAGPPFADLPEPARETRLTLLDARGGLAGGGRLALVVVAPLTYPLADLTAAEGASPAERLGQVTRTLARYCSDAVLFVRRDIGAWARIEGAAIWSCAARPPDRRLPATLAAVVVALAMLGWLAGQRAALERVLAAMRDQLAGVGGGRIPSEGPAELRALAEAAGDMAAREAARLADRVAVLAGVSHDLGAPMTRLRLRAALIQDPDLRARVTRDLDQMADMIEGVLTHTREEMATEVPRLVSVQSLVQAVADDFADMGAPVRLIEPGAVAAEAPATVFAGGTGLRSGGQVAAADRRMLARVRPGALARAVTNLVDNALKYGRRAEIALEGDAATLTIVVRDAGGGGLRAAELEALVAPFQRGANARATRGAGMGLAIVDGVARQHGGALAFADAGGGIAARLTIRRG
jgi:signal transduction histidine kinase